MKLKSMQISLNPAPLGRRMTLARSLCEIGESYLHLDQVEIFGEPA